MATPPTLIAANTVVVTSGTTVTSSSLTVQTNDVVTFTAIGEGASAGASFGTPTSTITNSGITNLKLHASASDPEGGIWTMTVTGAGSGTVSVPHTGTGLRCALTVFVHRGGTAPTAARSALGTGSSRTVSYTASQVDSAIVWAVGDWAAAAVQTPTPTSTTHGAAAPGPTAMPQGTTVAGAYTQNSAVLDDQTSVAAVSYGVGGTGTGPFTIVVAEIQGTGGAVAIPPIIVMPPRRS